MFHYINYYYIFFYTFLLTIMLLDTSGILIIDAFTLLTRSLLLSIYIYTHILNTIEILQNSGPGGIGRNRIEVMIVVL